MTENTEDKGVVPNVGESSEAATALYAPTEHGGLQELSPQSKEEQDWATYMSLSTFSGYFIPLGTIIGPLIMWNMRKDVMPFVDQEGRAILNFQISMLIWLVVSAALISVFVGILLLPALGVLHIVFSIIGAVKNSSGKRCKYPLAIKFLN